MRQRVYIVGYLDRRCVSKVVPVYISDNSLDSTDTADATVDTANITYTISSSTDSIDNIAKTTNSSALIRGTAGNKLSPLSTFLKKTTKP